jgi:nucleotide-binding universal stress UspA family protein
MLVGGDDPIERLARLAREGSFDVVAVGVHSRTGLDAVRTGAVARGLLHHGLTAVLAIPLLDDRDAASRGALRFQSVLVPTDLFERSNRAIPFACALVRAGGTLTVLHVQRPASEASFDPATSGDDISLERAGLVQSEMAEAGITARMLTVDGQNVAGAIVEVARRLGVDAICMTSRGRSAISRAVLGSITESVVHEFENPVLLVRR